MFNYFVKYQILRNFFSTYHKFDLKIRYVFLQQTTTLTNNQQLLRNNQQLFHQPL